MGTHPLGASLHPHLLVAGALLVGGPATAIDAAEGREQAAGGHAAHQPEAAPGAEGSVQELEARSLFALGVQMAEAERWAEAEKHFAKAEALVPRASTAFNRALALYRLGRIREMLVALNRFLDLSDPVTDADDRAHAGALRQSGEATLATVRVQVSPPDARVLVDGEAVPGARSGTEMVIRVDPGDHVVTAELAGFAPERAPLSLSAGEQATLSLTLRAEPAALGRSPGREPAATGATSDGPPLGAMVLTVAGAASLVAAGVTGAMAFHLDSQVDDGCTRENACFEDLEDDQDRMESLALGSTWLTAAGVALAGAGVTWWLLAPSRDSTASMSGWLGPASAGVKGRF